MPGIGPSTFRRRIDYERLEGSGSQRWFCEYRWLIIIPLIFIGVVIVTFLFTMLAVRSSYENSKLRFKQSPPLLITSPVLKSSYISMPRISQLDIEDAYREAMEGILAEAGDGDDGLKTFTEEWKWDNDNETLDGKQVCHENVTDQRGDCGNFTKEFNSECHCHKNTSKRCKNITEELELSDHRHHHHHNENNTKVCCYDFDVDTECGCCSLKNITENCNCTKNPECAETGMCNSRCHKNVTEKHDGDANASAVRAYQYLNSNITDETRKLIGDARVLERVTQIIAKRFNLDRNQITTGLSEYEIHWHNCSSRDGWPQIMPSNCSGQYRSYDGTCNNLKHQNWGIAGTAYRRSLPPDYGDGISSPRQSSKEGHSLPSARDVSYKIHLSKRANDDKDHTTLMTFWGQFITHDISKAASTSGTPSCCGPSALNASACYPINISENDPVFSKLNVTCLPFIRSQAFAHPNCLLGPRQQMNLLTSYLDGSAIYGSSEEETIELRSLENGLMETSIYHGDNLMPVKTSDPSSFCTQASSSKMCFVAGDSRCNENLMLTSLHTIFLREHNRLSSKLKKNHPDWTDEKLFQEARRIVVAELQHITYNEYLPRLLGTDVIAAHDLQLVTDDQTYYNGYSDEVDATIANEFSTAVFRFGHSMVTKETKSINASGDVELIQLHKGFFTPWRFQDNNDTLASIIYGASRQNALLVSTHYTEELVNRLFQGENDRAGLDLAAINVQRGRDHGIPSYNMFRKLCGMAPVRTATDLKRSFGNEVAKKFLRLYRNLEDIDLSSGGLAESHVADGLLGPTFACLAADQFLRLRRGDRFWYENGHIAGYPAPFTRKQLVEIRKSSLARVICDNVPTIKHIQPNVFSAVSSKNAVASCSAFSKIPRVNLESFFI